MNDLLDRVAVALADTREGTPLEQARAVLYVLGRHVPQPFVDRLIATGVPNPQRHATFLWHDTFALLLRENGGDFRYDTHERDILHSLEDKVVEIVTGGDRELTAEEWKSLVVGELRKMNKRREAMAREDQQWP